MRSGMKISILLPDLRPGGAERMRLHMADWWIRKGLDVEFVLCRQHGDLLEQLPVGATVCDLGAARVRNALLPLANYLRQRTPDALLAAMWPLTVISPLAAKATRFGGRVVISEHAPQSRSHAGRGWLHNAVMAATMHWGYRMANGRVGVSSGVADDMAKLSRMGRAAFDVVPNPAATGQVAACYELPGDIAGLQGPLVLSVGNLKAVKRHDLLIRAFAKLPRGDATLCILGEGAERARLSALVEELGLEGRVLLPGYRRDPAPWYAHADVFVLASDHEGFGNVIVEALEQGVPVVCTDCPVGPRDILDGGKYGTLVPVDNVEALAQAMEEALLREHDREALKRRAQDFSVQRAADSYLDLLIPDWRQGLVPEEAKS